jgi:hypothetical protein
MYVSPELMRQYRPGSPWCSPFGVVQCSEVEAVQALDFRLSGPCDDVDGIEGLERCLPPANAELTLQLQRGLTWRLGCHAERAPEPRERRIAAASDTSARQRRQIFIHYLHVNMSRRAAFPDRPRLRRSGKPARNPGKLVGERRGSMPEPISRSGRLASNRKSRYDLSSTALVAVTPRKCRNAMSVCT